MMYEGRLRGSQNDMLKVIKYCKAFYNQHLLSFVHQIFVPLSGCIILLLNNLHPALI